MFIPNKKKIRVFSKDFISHLRVVSIWTSVSPSPQSPAALLACHPHPHTAEPHSVSPDSLIPARPGPPWSPRCLYSSSVPLFLCPGSPAGKPSAASAPAAQRHSGWSARATERSCPVLTKVVSHNWDMIRHVFPVCIALRIINRMCVIQWAWVDF